MDNYLISPIQALIDASQKPLSVYQIIEQMQQQGYLLDYNLGNVEHLFAVNFLVNNALYTLQSDYAQLQRRYLSISALAVELKPAVDINSTLEKMPEHRNSADTHLRAYYGCWENLESANKDSINHLLTSFWQQFISDDDYYEALAIFELSADCDIGQVKKRYRELAMRHHPDRGGKSAHFQSVNQAMAVLQKRLASR